MSQFNSLKNNQNATIIDGNMILLKNTYYHKCVKCKGSGNVQWGVCYDCNGKGIYNTESVTEYNNRIENAKREWIKYTETEKYKEDKKQNDFQRLVLAIQHHEKATDWDSNFAYTMNCWKYNKVSLKQKNILLKLSLKYHNEIDVLRFKEILEF